MRTPKLANVRVVAPGETGLNEFRLRLDYDNNMDYNLILPAGFSEQQTADRLMELAHLILGTVRKSEERGSRPFGEGCWWLTGRWVLGESGIFSNGESFCTHPDNPMAVDNCRPNNCPLGLPKVDLG